MRLSEIKGREKEQLYLQVGEDKTVKCPECNQDILEIFMCEHL